MSLHEFVYEAPTSAHGPVWTPRGHPGGAPKSSPPRQPTTERLVRPWLQGRLRASPSPRGAGQRSWDYETRKAVVGAKIVQRPGFGPCSGKISSTRAKEATIPPPAISAQFFVNNSGRTQASRAVHTFRRKYCDVIEFVTTTKTTSDLVGLRDDRCKWADSIMSGRRPPFCCCALTPIAMSRHFRGVSHPLLAKVTRDLIRPAQSSDPEHRANALPRPF